jgi:hypothetical protein
MLHAKPLLLIDDDHPEILETHIRREEPVSPDNEIHGTIGQTFHHLALLSGCAVTAEEFDAHRILAHPLLQCPGVLLGENRRGCQKDNLFSTHE